MHELNWGGPFVLEEEYHHIISVFVSFIRCAKKKSTIIILNYHLSITNYF